MKGKRQPKTARLALDGGRSFDWALLQLLVEPKQRNVFEYPILWKEPDGETNSK